MSSIPSDFIAADDSPSPFIAVIPPPPPDRLSPFFGDAADDSPPGDVFFDFTTLSDVAVVFDDDDGVFVDFALAVEGALELFVTAGDFVLLTAAALDLLELCF